MATLKRAIFIERDGILNDYENRDGMLVAPTQAAKFVLRKNVLPFLLRIKGAGFICFVTTHQPGISEGTLLRRELDCMHMMLSTAFPFIQNQNILVCPHGKKDNCPCQHAQPGLLQEAINQFAINPGGSFVVSDKWQDVRAAQLASIRSLQIQSPWVRKEVKADRICKSFAEATSWLCNNR